MSPAQFSLSRRSEAVFGARRGLTRLLDLFEDVGVSGTSSSLGWLQKLAQGWSKRSRVRAMRLAIMGTGICGRVMSMRPVSAVSSRKGWTRSSVSLALLDEYGFRCDSSLMDDDRPYRIGGCCDAIVEFPVHWSLDDVPFYGCPDQDPLTLNYTDALEAVWFAEATSASRERRHVTFTIHPEVSGRGYRALALEHLIARIAERTSVWWPTLDAVIPYVR